MTTEQGIISFKRLDENLEDGTPTYGISSNNYTIMDDISDESSEGESFHDSHYGSEEDDLEYDVNVDYKVEYCGVSQYAKLKGKSKMSKKTELPGVVETGKHVPMDDMDYDSDEGIDGYASDTERPRGKVFDPRTDMPSPKFELLMKFSDTKIFQEAVKRHAIIDRRPIKFLFQTSKKVKAVCKAPCNWNIYASKDHDESHLLVKTLNPIHTCAQIFKTKYTTSSWLAKEFVSDWKEDPNKGAQSIKNKVLKDYTVNVSKQQIYRAKAKALNMINGSADEQYSMLWDYAQELRMRNPGSTVNMKLVDGSVELGSPRFERFYVCLAGLKSGFQYCRKILSVDGCFLKGEYKGQLLAASGIDPNNNWYPIAYAVVESECRDSWSWFMKQLIEDLEINDVGFCIMSDKQKGLIETVKELLPNAEHRFCVMHMLANMRSAGFKGVTYKNLLWNAAKATTVSRFTHCMEEMAQQDINAFHWFDDKPPCNWSRSAFSTSVKCDILLNNLSESFNSHILEAREKPILSCLESIRNMLMVRLENNRTVAKNTWTGRLCPKIFKELERNKKMVSDCIPSSAGSNKFEVSHMYGAQYSVNLADKACTCRRWELTGIPCSHAISCIVLKEGDPESYVDECYSTETYKKVYNFLINPMDGPSMWPKTGYQAVLPPLVKRMPGRPKKMRRRSMFDKDKEKEKAEGVAVEVATVLEDGTSKLKRRVYTKPNKCGVCKGDGHNKRGCPLLKQNEPTNEPTNEVGEVPLGTKPNKCSVCKTSGHNKRGCPLLKQIVPTSETTNEPQVVDNTDEYQVDEMEAQGTPPPITQPVDNVVHSEPPPGVMQMVVPAGRDKVTPNLHFADIGESSPQPPKRTQPNQGESFQKGGKNYITLSKLKATNQKKTRTGPSQQKKVEAQVKPRRSVRVEANWWFNPNKNNDKGPIDLTNEDEEE